MKGYYWAFEILAVTSCLIASFGSCASVEDMTTLSPTLLQDDLEDSTELITLDFNNDQAVELEEEESGRNLFV